jgi:rubrerythrin
LHDFVRANNNAIEFELPDEDYYLAMAKEIRNGQV